MRGGEGGAVTFIHEVWLRVWLKAEPKLGVEPRTPKYTSEVPPTNCEPPEEQ